jgi:hypothetical protein
MENERKKPIHDAECISCKKFFTCKHGKERVGQACISFEERGDSKWERKDG